VQRPAGSCGFWRSPASRPAGRGRPVSARRRGPDRQAGSGNSPGDCFPRARLGGSRGNARHLALALPFDRHRDSHGKADGEPSRRLRVRPVGERRPRAFSRRRRRASDGGVPPPAAVVYVAVNLPQRHARALAVPLRHSTSASMIRPAAKAGTSRTRAPSASSLSAVRPSVIGLAGPGSGCRTPNSPADRR